VLNAFAITEFNGQSSPYDEIIRIINSDINYYSQYVFTNATASSGNDGTGTGTTTPTTPENPGTGDNQGGGTTPTTPDTPSDPGTGGGDNNSGGFDEG
jgi:hypothetical protein